MTSNHRGPTVGSSPPRSAQVQPVDDSKCSKRSEPCRPQLTRTGPLICVSDLERFFLHLNGKEKVLWFDSARGATQSTSRLACNLQ